MFSGITTRLGLEGTLKIIQSQPQLQRRPGPSSAPSTPPGPGTKPPAPTWRRRAGAQPPPCACAALGRGRTGAAGQLRGVRGGGVVRRDARRRWAGGSGASGSVRWARGERR